LGKPKVDADSVKQAKMALPASKAAEIIIKAVENNKYRATIGKDATMLDILYRLSPRFATNFIGKMMKKALKNG
jgi:short-subunit dehydrogenase